jgi:tetratricopeptide (TPR) repeat protein
MPRLRLPALVLLASLGLLAAGCAKKQYPLNSFFQYDYDQAVKGYRATVAQTKEKDEKNVVLADIHYAGATFVAGDYRDAQTALVSASKIMEDVAFGADRGQQAMAFKHSIRVFKGEPYERAVAYTYLGFMFYRRGDFENARSAFNLALLADRGSKGDNEDYRDDFALAYYLIGKTYLKLGEADTAAIAFGKVKKYMPDNPFADPARLKDTNFTLLVELGCGPKKRPDRVVGSVDVIEPCVYPERSAEVFLDGQSLGKAAKLVDVNYQGTTSGSSSRDTAQAVKGAAVAVLKQIPFVGIIGGLVEMAGVNKADLRHWRHMPGEVHVLEAKVADGLHTVQIKFFDGEGKELERFQQVHHFVRVGDPVSPEVKTEPIFIVRSGLDRHNLVRPKGAEYLRWGNAGEIREDDRGFESAFGPDAGVPFETTN